MNPPTKVVKPHAEILDPERGRDYIPIQAGPDPSKEEHKHPEAKAVVPSELSWARVEQTSAKAWCTRVVLAFIGIAFVAVYIFLIIFATLQTRSAANAPRSQLGGYSSSDYGWEVTYFNTFDFIDAPKTLSGRLSSGKNIKCTGRLRLEVFFNTIMPSASGGTISVTLRMIVPESWKDETKPPKPWYTITCQFGNAVITVDQNSNPSSYDQLYTNFRLDQGSYNNYPFDEYTADATAWCYFDATVANSRAPKQIMPPSGSAPIKSPTRSPTPTGGCPFTPYSSPQTSSCCKNLYVFKDPTYGTFINSSILFSNNSMFHLFGCCSPFAACCSTPLGDFQDDDGIAIQASGPLSSACIVATTTASDPSPCNASLVDTYSRRDCAESLFYPADRRLTELYDETQDSLSLDEWEEEQDRGLATAKYIPIAPYFSPTQGYLNFEVAIEKSDSGLFNHAQTYNGVSISKQTDLYFASLGQEPVVVTFDVIEFPILNFSFLRAPINKVFAVYLMIALWMIVLSHTFVNFTFYSGLKKVDVAALVTGAVSVLFALPAVRNNMPGAPPLGAIMDFAVYFWCIIISISHILIISVLWLDNTFFNPPPKKEVKPMKVIIVEETKKIK